MADIPKSKAKASTSSSTAAENNLLGINPANPSPEVNTQMMMANLCDTINIMSQNLDKMGSAWKQLADSSDSTSVRGTSRARHPEGKRKKSRPDRSFSPERKKSKFHNLNYSSDSSFHSSTTRDLESADDLNICSDDTSILHKTYPKTATTKNVDILADLDEEYKSDEVTGAPVLPKLANIVNNRFQNRIAESKLKDKLEKYRRPENCPGLATPLVNLEIWGQLGNSTKKQDLRMANIQKSLVKASTAVTLCLNDLSKPDSNNIDINCLISKLVDATALIGHAVQDISYKRRDLIKPSLNKDYASLCSSRVPIKDNLLFGDELQKSLSNIKESNKLSSRHFSEQQQLQVKQLQKQEQFQQSSKDTKQITTPKVYNPDGHTENSTGCCNRNTGSPFLANTILVSEITQNSSDRTSQVKTSQVAFVNRKSTSPSTQKSESSCVLSFRETKNLKLSDSAVNIVSQSWRTKTQSQYKTHINKWNTYCKASNIDTVNPSVEDGINFLATLADSDLSYSTINSARSALSSILPIYNGLTFGNQPIVKRFLKGTFNKKPPQQKLAKIWDVNLVFNHLSCFPKTEDLDLKTLSLKLATLLALLTAQRVQTLKFLKLDNMTLTQDSYMFIITDLLKQSRPGFSMEPIKLYKFSKNSGLCIYSILTEYILKRTKLLRGDHTQLLISYKPPHSPVTTDTISRWIRSVLKQSGVDTEVFTSHSTRSAVTSKLKTNNSPIDLIMKAAGWSNTTTFTRFYFKPIDNESSQSTGSTVATSLLNSCNN